MKDLSVIELHTPPCDFLPDEPEGAAFHTAFQESGVNEFDCRYLEILRNGKRIAVVPYFLNTLSLATLLPDCILKKFLSWVKFRIACVGHPSTDFGVIDGEISAEILALVNAILGEKAMLVGYKGFADNLRLPGFARVRGLPVPVLKICGDYYSELNARRRNDFKHKLEKAQSLRVDEYSFLPEHLAQQVFQLYMNTYNHAPQRFERLTLAYFQKTAAISTFLLFHEDETLIGFAQLIAKKNKAAFKYVGMDYSRNRQYGLYYVICLKCVEICLRDGYQQLEFGVTSYHFKRLLGCELIETSLYYRHNNQAANWLLRKLKFLLEPAPEELL